MWKNRNDIVHIWNDLVHMLTYGTHMLFVSSVKHLVVYF